MPNPSTTTAPKMASAVVHTQRPRTCGARFVMPFDPPRPIANTDDVATEGQFNDLATLMEYMGLPSTNGARIRVTVEVL
jgi:predicted ester cyclase